MSGDWCTIESDPGVFTELIGDLGVSGVQVEELYSLEGGVFEELPTVYGLIFLFKWIPGVKDERPTCNPENVFFARQVINNACATQAILSILMNGTDLHLGQTLTNFKNNTVEFDPESKGLAIGNEPLFQKAHNNFARPEPAFSDGSGKGKPEDVYHFVSYLPAHGRLYELDGLKAGPIDLGECTNENWLSKVTPVIQSRIEKYEKYSSNSFLPKYSQSEIRFNLMALIKNKKQVYEEKIAELREQKAVIEQTLAALPGDMETDEKDELANQIQILDDKIEQYQGFVGNEEAKFANWKTENIRRRHNYIPFLFNLLKVLAEKDLLVPLIEKAKDKQKQKEKEKAEQK